MTSMVFDAFWRDHGVEKGIRGIGKDSEQTHGKFSKFTGAAGKSLKGLGGLAAGAAAGGAAALGALGAAGAAVGVKIASGNEQARISFTTMLGSASKADKFLRNLQKFAASTPFEFPELQTAASSLISAGINADKVIPIMRTLGDVTSGMGTGSEGVQRATIALQQMSAAGKITGEDLNQLRDAGIPVFDLLAKATGKSKEEVVKLAQSGKLGKKELGEMMKALESGKGLERFSGLMDKQSKSLAGTWSTLKDTIGQGLAGVMENSLPILKDGIGTISSLATQGFGWIDKNKGAISNLFDSARVSIGTFGRIAASVFRAFISSTGDGTKSFKSFADWVATNQEAITRAMLGGAKGALMFGRTLASSASAGLRAFAFLLDGVTTATQGVLLAVSSMAKGAVLAFGWVPGLGPKLKAASNQFDRFSQTAIVGARKAADGARSLADGIDKRVVPAIDKGAAALDKMSSKEIVKAKTRDDAKRAAKAIDAIGTSADGSQVKLKKFSDISKLGADQQRGLMSRIDNARSALRKQINTMQDAHAGQDKLSAAWKKGKDRLYDEFKQMGLSNREAKKLADRYAGVKPKVRTKFETPGLADASHDTKVYTNRQGDVDPRIRTNVSVHFGSSGKVALHKGGRMTYVANATGGVLPGFTPGRDVHRFVNAKTGTVLDLSGGEAIMRPEWTRAVGGPKEVARMNAAARHGATLPFADGGTVPSFGKATRAWRPAKAAGRVVAANAAADVNAAAVALLKAAAARAAAAMGGGNGGYSGPVGAGASGIRALARHFHPSYIAGHRDPQGGPAFDIGSSGAKNNNIANAMRSNHGRLGLRYVISQMRISSARSGWRWRRYHPITGSGDFRHVGHVHVSYDQGGMIRSGTGFNGSGKPERILSPRQTAAFERLVPVLQRNGGAAAVNITINAPNYVGSREELRQTIVKMYEGGQLRVLDRTRR